MGDIESKTQAPKPINYDIISNGDDLALLFPPSIDLDDCVFRIENDQFFLVQKDRRLALASCDKAIENRIKPMSEILCAVAPKSKQDEVTVKILRIDRSEGHSGCKQEQQ